MSHHFKKHDPQRAKRRDIARSTLSLTARLRAAARHAKRLKKKRLRRRINVELGVLAKENCGCPALFGGATEDESRPWCSRCDAELHQYRLARTHGKWGPGWSYDDIQIVRWQNDALSPALRWFTSTSEGLTRTEAKDLINSFGDSVADRHAKFHFGFAVRRESDEVTDPIVTKKKFTRILHERGLEFRSDPIAMLVVIARQSVASGGWCALDEWSKAVTGATWAHEGKLFAAGRANRWNDWRTFEPTGHWNIESGVEWFASAHRILESLADVDAWATDLAACFDVVHGHRFLSSPAGFWYLTDLVETTIPIRKPVRAFTGDDKGDN